MCACTVYTVWPLEKVGCFNLFAPNIQIQILQTDLHTFRYKISWENLIKNQGIFPLVIISLIYITVV